MPYRLASALLGLALLFTVSPARAGAQDASPVASGPVDLAAMALTSDEVPDGFFDDYAEWWVPGAVSAEFMLGGGETPEGLVRVYQTFYFSDGQGIGIHCFLYEFASPEAATGGAGIVDDALRPPLPEGTATDPEHATGPALGDGVSTTTTVSFDTREAGGPLVDVSATSFQSGSLIAGIAIERYTDPDPTHPLDPAASPVGSEDAQELATRLATTLAGRVQTVLGGGSPAGVDTSLSDRTLPLHQLGGETIPVFGGYKAGIDMLRCGICGEENSLLQFGDEALGGFNRGLSL
jgi:hypothetical protein